jgi:heme/copper-type cytochrome/quinol oxidase subunit 2
MDDAAPFMLVLMPIIWVGVAAIFIIPHWKIFQRAGYSGAMALLLLLPVVNFIVLFWLAFSEWPALRGRQGGMR